MNLHKLFLNFREFCISFAEVFLSLSLSESLHTFVIRRIKRESRVCSNWAALQAGGRQPQKSVHCAQSFKTFCSWQRLSKQRSAAPKMSIAQIACAHTKWKEAIEWGKGKEREVEGEPLLIIVNVDGRRSSVAVAKTWQSWCVKSAEGEQRPESERRMLADWLADWLAKEWPLNFAKGHESTNRYVAPFIHSTFICQLLRFYFARLLSLP